MAQGYTAVSAAAVALAAATAKTVLAVRAGTTTRVVQVCELSIGFDGTTGNAAPVLVELVRITFAGVGAGSTAITPQHLRGPAGASVSTAASGYTTEPTAVAVLKNWSITPAAGQWTIQFPLGREPQSEPNLAQASAIGIRCTAPAIVNCRPYIEFEE